MAQNGANPANDDTFAFDEFVDIDDDNHSTGNPFILPGGGSFGIKVRRRAHTESIKANLHTHT